ncbi:CaiB/BaiF CoA transferase family protein [Ammoniphilus resinae]|uniref:Crotonobetainyl-CoA:carnitine CoA-transferase CaiB-like acyl-CoA transferase n=1 Tax=Ammoniphilus resinae TaxID=861532 RepID=A0ABS4GM21_9BACL|nr:CoA transferase [Ammoniphilus resinae]MBP1930940.1 crotonobetainyl-CoA:carnitine CoA-transferase CaiB-like acyl-CoA transferase [Ammoniphilus resinae]
MIALKGVKILDLTQFLAGPYCTMVLADFGAEVIKIEKFPDGDDSRRTRPYINNESMPSAMPNRNKKSLAIDLKSEKGKEIFLKLAKEADIITENFRPGVTKKLGIDYDAIHQFNPGIIYCSISGFGQTGPYSKKGGFDIIAQGITGFMTMTGHPDSRPAKVGIAINDIAAGSAALYSILAAYIHKLQTGEGQYIDTSLVEAGLAWTVWEQGAYFGSGEVPTATGTRHRRSTPYQAYRTSDGYVTVGAGTQRLWERFCQDVVVKPEWIQDVRYADLKNRMENIDELERDIEEVLTKDSTAYWVKKLDAAGIPGGPVYTYDQTLSDPHLLAREMVVDLKHPIMGDIKTIGVPVKLSKTPMAIRSAAPWLGQHTTEVLKGMKFSEEEIERFYADGVVYRKYPGQGG